ncbi:ABC1 kinase family protein [Ruicaihuangia caeni]|uniref:AarF/UbiB family protein n=1 Tax=Ruicaihuangia caeni TaxID=3042517 RepID=A0AAW6T8Y3_9MICO|nr:AarF/UbiB family protein [Klugiella sp. YN-L-19]MDI2099684.1 AarF/UbiB family protein [Klugiella sp. YN-L-19]
MADVRQMRARYRRLLRFALRYMIEAWWFELVLPRIGLRGPAARGRQARLRRIARNFRVLAVALGGLMIKVGQFMSSRLDVLPPEITKELEGLQDEVPPEEFEAIRALAEAELGLPLERAYAYFDPTPLAAASLGQAHRARLTAAAADDTGFSDAVVKVQRPGIEAIIAVDLAALRKVAGWLQRVRLVSSHVDAPRLVEEFAKTSLEEVDYLHEAQNAERFAAAFADDERVQVPAIAWERSTRRVLTLQDVTAIKINDVEALRAAGIDPSAVARDFAPVMLDQLFIDGFFHADPHPGNLFVTPVPGGPDVEGRRWTLTFIDFGMMGEVSDSLRQGLQRFLIAVAARDGRQLVESIRALGVLLPGAETRQLEQALTALFARFGGMGFAELRQVDERELRRFAIEFGDTMRSLPFQLPENFLLIIRAMSLTSGMCSGLDPTFNIWSAVEPYAARLLREEGGGAVRQIASDALDAARTLASLPRRIDSLTDRLEEGRLAIEVPRLEQRVRALERMGRRLVSAVLFAGLFVGGILLRNDDDDVLGSVLMLVSVPPLLHAVTAGLVRRRRSD